MTTGGGTGTNGPASLFSRCNLPCPDAQVKRGQPMASRWPGAVLSECSGARVRPRRSLGTVFLALLRFGRSARVPVPCPSFVTLSLAFAMKKHAPAEPRGAGLIRSAPLTPADEQELSAFLAQSKRRNAAYIRALQRRLPPAPLPGPAPGGERDG